MSTATERGLLNWPTPTPRVPMICAERNKRLRSGASFEGVSGVHPASASTASAGGECYVARYVLRGEPSSHPAPRTTTIQASSGATANTSSVRHSAFTCALWP